VLGTGPSGPQRSGEEPDLRVPGPANRALQTTLKQRGPRSILWCMAKRNVTVQVDEEVIQQAKMIAARRGTSISSLLAQQLCAIAAADARYEQAKQHALGVMANAGDHGGVSWRREDLYTR
jgi:hypothetical protein